MVISPIGPAPKTATVSPSRSAANCMECSTTASGSMMVASRALKPDGIPTRLCAGMLAYSRKNPGSPGMLMKRKFAQTL